MGKTFYNNNVKNIDLIMGALTINMLMEHYGIKVHGSKINCPLPNHGGADSTPSFSIKDEHFYQCFGCGSSGSSLNFIMDFEEVGYLESVQIASEITGIEPIFSALYKEQSKSSESNKLMEWLNNKYFTKHDYGNENWKKLNDYSESRGIKRETASAYGIGYSDGEYEEILLDNAVEYKVIKSRNSIEDVQPLVDLGLLRIVDGTDVVATLKDCITFPIYKDGVIVGFEGRNLNEDVIKKYGKYNKSACKFKLFNSDVVDDVVFIYEGVFDCLTAIQCGEHTNSLALLGVNALGEQEKAVLLKAGKIFLHFDDDETGQRRALEIAEELGYKAHIVEPIGVGGEIKDLNGLFTSVYNTYSASMSEEDAFNKTVNDVRKNLNKRTFGTEVESDDEDAEPTFVGGAKNLVQIRLEEWLSFSDSKRAEKFQDLIKIVYKQFSGQSALLSNFKNLLKEKYKISAKVFDDTVKAIKNEVSLTVRSSSNTPSFGNAEIRYEINDNILYKMTPIILKGEVLTEKMDEISTTIPIIKGILYDKSDNKEKVEIEFTNSSGKVIKIITPKETILKKNAIIDALGSKGLDVTDVTSQDIILWLRQYTKENSIPRKELVKMTGLYKVDGQYYCICQRGEIISEKGLIDDFSLVYDSQLIDRSIKEITEINYDEWKESVNAIPMILKLNERANTLALTSYMLSSVFREYFYEERGAFSVFQVTGLKGSGKSTIVKALMMMVCGHNKPLNAKISRFVLTANLSMSNAFLLVMDEYKASDLKYQNGDLMYLAKCSYDSSKDEKGKATQDVNRYYYHRPMLIAGENKVYGEDSDAVKERAGIITLTNNWIKTNRKITKPIVTELNKMDLSKFTGGYLQFALKLLNSGRADEIFGMAEKRAYEFSENYGNQLTDRHILTMTILAFGIELIKLLYEEVGIESDITDEDYEEVFKNALNHAINREDMETSLDRTMNFVATTLIKEFPEGEKIFDASKHILCLSRATFFSLLETYRFQHKAEIPESSGLKQYIEDSFADEEGYIIEKNKGKTINGKTVRYIWIDTKKLSEIAHIDEAKWLGMGGEAEQEIFTDGISARVYQSEETRNLTVASQLASIVINNLKCKLEGDIANENSIKAEIRGIIIDRLDRNKEIIRDEFIKEMVSRYLKLFEKAKHEEMNVKEIFKEDKIS